jgi:hypothetical protein
MNLLERPVPSPVENDEKWTPWVAKRWVTGTLTRLFSRYECHVFQLRNRILICAVSLIVPFIYLSLASYGQKRTKGLPENIAFGELFINSYAVPLLDSFFNV